MLAKSRKEKLLVAARDLWLCRFEAMGTSGLRRDG